jgi:hypothetical protein
MTRFRIENDCLVATEDDKTEVKTEVVATLESSPVIAMMLSCGIPLTRENYIRANYWEDRELSAEEESELPLMFRDNPPEDVAE